MIYQLWFLCLLWFFLWQAHKIWHHLLEQKGSLFRGQTERASSPAYFQGRASPGSTLQACQLATDCTVGCLRDLHPKWDILTAKPDREMKWVVQHLCRDPTLCGPAWPLQPGEGSLLVSRGQLRALPAPALQGEVTAETCQHLPWVNGQSHPHGMWEWEGEFAQSKSSTTTEISLFPCKYVVWPLVYANLLLFYSVYTFALLEMLWIVKFE